MRLELGSVRIGVGEGFREVSLVTRPRKHCYLARYGFVTHRTVYNTRCLFLMWKGKTIWIRRGL